MVLIYPLFLILLLCGCEKESTIVTQPIKELEAPLHVKLDEIGKELRQIETIPYLEAYITKVINEGSNSNLGFASKTMDGGYAHASDAHNIARYVVTLSGKQSSDDQAALASALFYTSNCGGCHGDDGKGIKGTFPNLTLTPLRGLTLKNKALRSTLEELTKSQ